jgi:prepilin-type N-terminal cleavage/methylation domain-containing protein
VSGREDTVICQGYRQVVRKWRGEGGFTLIEILVVISIVALLGSILVPALSKAKEKAKVLLGSSRQREVASGVSLYSIDNEDYFPDSVATVGMGNGWNWSDPRRMIASDEIYPGMHRAMSEYLGSYIEDAGTMYCPSAPRKYKYLQAAWEAGGEWDNPDNLFPRDPLTGTYCFYWNYTGLLYERERLFCGPQWSSGGRGQSKLLVSDYFGYDHWRTRNAFGSCEKFAGASSTKPEQVLLSDYWYRNAKSLCAPEVKLHAGYTDGHVGSFGSTDTVRMKVIMNCDTYEPYPDGVGAGEFYLPLEALR